MFKCDVCGCSGKGEGKLNQDRKEVSKMTSGTKMKRVVTEYREKMYKLSGGKVTMGREIVKEKQVCPECYKKVKSLTPEYVK